MWRPLVLCVVVFFFFQAEDGIRDWSVTGVQTCALPISGVNVTRMVHWAPGFKVVGQPLVTVKSVEVLATEVTVIAPSPVFDRVAGRGVPTPIREKSMEVGDTAAVGV